MPSRRNRLAIPKVNPNPRPPNERKPQPSAYTPPQAPTYEPPQGNGQGNATSTQQSRIDKLLGKYVKEANMPTVPGPPTQTALTADQVRNSLTNGATSALGLSSFQPSQGQPDPRTPDYWRNVNNLLFNTQSRIASLNLEGQRETLDQGKVMGDMATNRGYQQRGLGEEAMRSGLANSGWLSRNEAEDSTAYLRDVEDTNTRYDRSRADRATSVSQAIQDYISGEGDAASSALGDYLSSQEAQAQEGNPLLTQADINQLNRIIKGKKPKEKPNKPRNPGGHGSGPQHGGPR
jgi:hypothetical protein